MKFKSRLTRFAFKIHGWFGLTAGIFFLLFGLTGSMLMFRHSLDRYFNPELHHVEVGSRYVPIDSIYRNIVGHYPNLKKVVLHDFPADRYDSYEFMLYKNEQGITENYLYFVFVNPYTGQVMKEGSYQDMAPSFFRWLYSFHYSLQLGMPGKFFAAIIGLVMLLSLVTGAIVYRKHFWDALRFKAGLNFKNRRTTISALHRIVGVWALLFNAVLFFTGFLMNKEHLNPATWQVNKPIENQMMHANIDSLIMQAKQVVPGFVPIAVNIPTMAGQDILVRGQMPETTFFLFQGKASDVSFNAATGELKKVTAIEGEPFSKRFDWAIYQLHIGAFGSNLIRWLYVLLGLTPGLLSITGASLWLRRRHV